MSEKEEILEKEIILASERTRFEQWLITQRGISQRIAAMYGRYMARMLREMGTLLPTKEQCQQHRDSFLLNGKKSGYALQIVKTIRHYGKFIGRDLTVRYPKREKQKLPVFLTETELKQMLFACHSIKEKLALMLMGACGLRINEVCRLKVSDVNFDTATMRVPTTKTDSAWEIPISNDVVETIRAYIQYERPKNEYEELLLDQYSKPYNSLNCRGIRIMTHRIAKRAGIEKRVYPHMLRHSYATLLLKNGCPLPYVQRLLRHKDVKSTLIYAHVVEDGLKEIYERYAPLRLTPLTKNQAPFEQEQKSPLQNFPCQKCERLQSDFDSTRILNHKHGSRNGYI